VEYRLRVTGKLIPILVIFRFLRGNKGRPGGLGRAFRQERAIAPCIAIVTGLLLFAIVLAV
jgi:hypothetical protein